MKFEVQTYTLCQGWINCWTENNMPQTFETEADAQAEIDSFFRDIDDEIATGDRAPVEGYDLADFRIVKITERKEHFGINRGTHTPGDWKVEQWDNFPDQYVITDNNTRCIALIDKTDEQDKLNASLMSAAPKLLELAESCLDVLIEQCGFEECELILDLRAAIAKAKNPIE